MRNNVRCYLFNDEKKIFCVKHNELWRWVLPGGHVEEWEILHQALMREMNEELGIEVEIIWNKVWFEESNLFEIPLPVSTFRVDYISNTHWPQSKFEYDYFAKIVWWDFVIDYNEIFEGKWFAVDEFLSLDPKTQTYWNIQQVLSKNIKLLELL